jgi:hypothetical protein
VLGIGPQIGFLFPVGKEHQGCLNLKACNFAAENRPEGFTAWVTLAISPAAPKPPPKRPVVHKEMWGGLADPVRGTDCACARADVWQRAPTPAHCGVQHDSQSSPVRHARCRHRDG